MWKGAKRESVGWRERQSQEGRSGGEAERAQDEVEVERGQDEGGADVGDGTDMEGFDTMNGREGEILVVSPQPLQN